MYDVFSLQDGKKLGLIVADVCDKGVGAALFMVLFRSLIRANLMQEFNHAEKQAAGNPGDALVSALSKTNDFVASNHARASMFATVFAAVLEKDCDELHYLNCGHEPPVLIGASGETQRLMPGNPAIGMFPEIKLKSSVAHLRCGDCLIVFTDGVTDARSEDGSDFGEQQALNVLNKPSAIEGRLKGLKEAIHAHIGNAAQFDDITCIGIERVT